MSEITIVGNLTDDPELRFTPSGAPLARFTVAVNRRTFNRESNAWEDAGTDFHYVSAWKQLGENIAASLPKGSRVIVQGDLRQRHWVDDTTKEKRSAWEIRATSVGAELTWATATVAKVARRDGVPADDPWATASRTRPAGAPAAAASSTEAPF